MGTDISVCGTITDGTHFGLNFDLEIGKAYRLKYRDNIMKDTDCILGFVNNSSCESTLVFYGVNGVDVSKYPGIRAYVLKDTNSTKYLIPKQFMVRVTLDQILSGEIDIIKLVEDKNEILD